MFDIFFDRYHSLKEIIPIIDDCKFEIGRPQNLKQKTDLPNAPILLNTVKVFVCIRK